VAAAATKYAGTIKYRIIVLTTHLWHFGCRLARAYAKNYNYREKKEHVKRSSGRLAVHARPLWVNYAVLVVSRSLPVFPRSADIHQQMRNSLSLIVLQ